ncbi:8-oxo-dGTP pyrophosphatase MutT (NUDIX family) [Catenuloplanes nepalensis]|uniref:8-oxo-dGTP pyrophosphatase MutT (NUDIX family) n=1 Tax=Catenuloplanes nepalensis TaxID=587533 RepID=A0ABT9N0X9_9ACTN|nr:NUDIX domain-containing protein [Catenuloplanes nepalensis]MDP9797148.1 8-oxo-dGTP pyrophosphatase MutT (NUDIX family) [Catenuloplanes nepalensis]
MVDFVPRRAARVLLVDEAGRVLLFRGVDPGRPDEPYWFTVGGGLDEGETPAEAAARELREEAGLDLPVSALGAPVHADVTEFPFGAVWYRQEQEFFLVRSPRFEIDTSGFDEIERDSITSYRWWPVDELASAPEPVYPADLADVLRRVTAGA